MASARTSSGEGIEEGNILGRVCELVGNIKIAGRKRKRVFNGRG